MGPKHILSDGSNLKETMPRAESIIEMLPEDNRQRIRIKYQEELERRIKECYRDKEDRTVLEMMKRDREIVYLHSDKTGRIIIMDKGEYNSKMKEAVV